MKMRVLSVLLTCEPEVGGWRQSVREERMQANEHLPPVLPTDLKSKNWYQDLERCSGHSDVQKSRQRLSHGLEPTICTIEEHEVSTVHPIGSTI